MGGRDEEMLVGGLCLVLALLNAWRIWSAHRVGEVPLYRTRLKRSEVGAGKYAALLAIHAALTALLLVIAADLALGLGLRGR
jgi:hypothetical protein